MHEIGRAFGKDHGSIQFLLLQRGGIIPAARRRSLRTLTLAEREDISRGIASGSSIREITTGLQRAASTVSREVARHGGRPLYQANEADHQAWESALRPKTCLLAIHGKLRTIVTSKLSLDWSPEQISGWLKIRYPKNESMRVSHETVATMAGGVTVEVGVIGREGFVGLPAALGTGQSPNRYFVQIPGHGYRVKSKILTEQCEASSALRLCLLRSVQGLLVQTSQTAACNRVHDLHERLARWRLMCHERVQVDCVAITQEFLAMMLGTRRSSVSVAAGILQKAGLITYTRGHVTIEDLAGLKEAACECYQVVHDEYVRLGLL